MEGFDYLARLKLPTTFTAQTVCIFSGGLLK